MIDFKPHPLIALGKSTFNPEIHKTWYRVDYVQIEKDILAHSEKEQHQARLSAYRWLVLNDLFFIVNFIMKIPGANNQFTVGVCREVAEGPEGWCMDLWARYHWKSVVKTKARTLQRVVKYPEKCTMIASYARKAAKKFTTPIARILETDEILKACFPEVLYQDPKKEADKWSEDEGYIVKRQSKSRSEATIEAHGVKEGMPTGTHFDWILLDDLETMDDVRNPDVIQKGRDAVDLCNFLLVGSVEGADEKDTIKGGSVDVTGTPYSHTGIYIPHILEKKRADGTDKFLYRRKPATHDGTKDGKPVMMTQEALDDVYAELAKDGYGEYSFACQMLIDPTPKGTQELKSENLINIPKEDVPQGLVYFMTVDPAGDSSENKAKGDDWAIWIIGVEAKTSEMGIRKRYIINGFLDLVSDSAAPELLGRMFLHSGVPIHRVGYEFKGIAPAWVQNFCEYVRRNGGTLYEDPKMNMIERLKDGGRQKGKRITAAIAPPLNRYCYHIASSVPDLYNRKLREEMDKFGFWPDNGLDSLAYLDDMIRTFDFSIFAKTITANSYKRDEAEHEKYRPVGQRHGRR